MLSCDMLWSCSSSDSNMVVSCAASPKPTCFVYNVLGSIHDYPNKCQKLISTDCTQLIIHSK